MNTSGLHDWAASRRMASRVVGLDALELVRSRLERLAAEGTLEAGFVRGSLDGFRYLSGCTVATPRSLVLLALPRPAHLVTFRVGERDIELVLPPTYVKYRPIFDLVRGWFRDDLGLDSSQADLVNAPLKSLAAAAGLILYGRNNLGYVPGLGSYVQLIGLVTSFNLEPDGELLRIEDRRLGACESCRACAKACLTGTIGGDRFLVRAERCLTLFSESNAPFPETISPPSVDCLIGCLKCQEVCPANKGLLRREHTGLVFEGRETEAMLSGFEGYEASFLADLRAKFSTLRMTEDISLFARNLRRIVKGAAENLV
ncbi:MAG: 4Fe-4S double cluster binding domain-containing protein [Candidatus Aminicenantales bacterium]